jgi:hypothetical protein
MTLVCSCNCHSSRYNHLHIVLVVYILDAVLCDSLDEDALEIDRKTSLEFFCAHAHNLEALFVIDVGMVVLVE